MRRRPIWLTLIGIVILIGVALFGVELPEPVRHLIEQTTGISLPAPDESGAFRAVDVAGLPNVPASFGAAKDLLYTQVYAAQPRTFYCGCPFDADRQIDLSRCGVTPRKNAKRARRVEAEHVFPAYHFGQHRTCWREPVCEKSDGTRYKGRKCCEDTDPTFRAAHNDLHNLFPSVGEINGDRSNYRWGMISGEARAYGTCDIEVDSSIRRAEPPEHVRGDIARVYFYMEETYGFGLSDQQRQLFTAWNQSDPPDEWEQERNQRIAQIQGKGNRFIEEWSKK